MQQINSSIKGVKSSPISLDISYINSQVEKPLVIFCHGFKGFKDWGAWNLVAKKFAKNNFLFLKFNFSHNGTTPRALEAFENLDAFSENNYTIELEDLQYVIDWVKSEKFPLIKKWDKKIYLIGHSRGGGAVLVKTYEEQSVFKTATWAAIDSFDRFGTKEQIEKWERDGEHLFTNGRTGQKMPIKFQFYQDYIKNIDRLNIEKSVKNTENPLLIIHGKNDLGVNIESAKNIHSWALNSELVILENADHVFGSRHPFLEDELPKDLEKIVDLTINFFQK